MNHLPPLPYPQVHASGLNNDSSCSSSSDDSEQDHGPAAFRRQQQCNGSHVAAIIQQAAVHKDARPAFPGMPQLTPPAMTTAAAQAANTTTSQTEHARAGTTTTSSGGGAGGIHLRWEPAVAHRARDFASSIDSTLVSTTLGDIALQRPVPPPPPSPQDVDAMGGPAPAAASTAAAAVWGAHSLLHHHHDRANTNTSIEADEHLQRQRQNVQMLESASVQRMMTQALAMDKSVAAAAAMNSKADLALPPMIPPRANGDTPALPAGVTLDMWNALNGEIAGFERQKQLEIQEEVRRNAERISSQHADPLAPLPSQFPASVAFHKQLADRVSKQIYKEDLKLSGKALAKSRKQKRRCARKQKKAETYADRVEKRATQFGRTAKKTKAGGGGKVRRTRKLHRANVY